MIRCSRKLCALTASVIYAVAAFGQTATQPANSKIDAIATQVLQTTGVPSASIAVVKDGHLVYLQAYGKANLERNEPATPAMRVPAHRSPARPER